MMVEEQNYRPTRLLESGFRFQHHAFHEIGHMNGEEHECAMRIDGHPNVARWVRNTDRVSQGGFSLPLSPGRYFPDFVAELRDGRTALIEYKNSRLGSHAAELHKKAVGDLWAGRSNGTAVFSWVVDRDWVRLENELN
jgi:type III restriction enzyme